MRTSCSVLRRPTFMDCLKACQERLRVVKARSKAACCAERMLPTALRRENRQRKPLKSVRCRIWRRGCRQADAGSCLVLPLLAITGLTCEALPAKLGLRTRSCLVNCLRRWACAVLLCGRLLDIEACERVVLSSLRAFNHPEFRGVSSRV